jgi:hypothetical protein
MLLASNQGYFDLPSTWPCTGTSPLSINAKAVLVVAHRLLHPECVDRELHMNEVGAQLAAQGLAFEQRTYRRARAPEPRLLGAYQPVRKHGCSAYE